MGRWDGEGDEREVQEEGDMYNQLWLTYVDAWQKKKSCKAIIFQLKIFLK